MRLKLMFLLACSLFFTTANAQVKKWENNFYIGAGVPSKFESGDDYYTVNFGYGLNYYLNDKWSVMPGIAYRIKTSGDDALDGEETHEFSFVDFPIVAQYHWYLHGQSGIVFEAGPVFSIRTEGDLYYNDANPKDPLDGKQEYKKFDMGLQPAVYYQLGCHWRFGIKGRLGLLNIKKKYPESSGSYHYNDITATVNFHF